MPDFTLIAGTCTDGLLAIDIPNFVGDVLGEYGHGKRESNKGNGLPTSFS